MVQRFCSFIVALTFLWQLNASAQYRFPLKPAAKAGSWCQSFRVVSSYAPQKPGRLAETPFHLSISSTCQVKPDTYSQHLGFFCRKELAFERITSIPIKFRLGSLEECNRMEGKSQY